MKKYIDSSIAIIIGVLLVVGSVQAATTISENIATGGTLSVTGTTTLVGNVGIGTTTPSHNLVVDGNMIVTNGALVYPDSYFGASDRAVAIGSWLNDDPFIEVLTMGWIQPSTGAVLGGINSDGTGVFDAVTTNDLTVNASSSLTDLSISGNLTVTGTTNGVKVYRALLTQTGTNAPVATVLENSLGEEVVWSYVSDGEYTVTLSGAFPDNKTFAPGGPAKWEDGVIFEINRINNDSLRLRTFNSSYLGLDDILASTPIEILVYP